MNIYEASSNDIFQDVKYDACILVDADDGKPWCSTKTDTRGNHIGGQGQWGHCAGSCPVEGKKDDSVHVNVEGSSSISNTKLSQIPWLEKLYCMTSKQSENICSG